VGHFAVDRCFDVLIGRLALPHQLTGLDQGLTLSAATAFVAGVADLVAGPLSERT
jgi:hypothetical protein